MVERGGYYSSILSRNFHALFPVLIEIWPRNKCPLYERSLFKSVDLITLPRFHVAVGDRVHWLLALEGNCVKRKE